MKIDRMHVALVISLGVVAGAIFGGARADENDETKRAGSTLRACYLMASTFYGHVKCDPPPALVGAVFGKCSAEEQVIMQNIRKWHGSALIDNKDYLDNLLIRMHQQITPEIESWILDAQANNSRCR